MNKSWITTNGGPLICCDVRTRANWRGINGTSVTNDARSDYLRACAEKELLGKLECGRGQILILGDEAYPSRLIKRNGMVAIVRWIACSSEKKADQIISSDIFDDEGRIEQDPIEIALSGKLCLFDSADDQMVLADDVAVIAKDNLKQYFVTTELFEERGSYRFLVHKLYI